MLSKSALQIENVLQRACRETAVVNYTILHNAIMSYHVVLIFQGTCSGTEYIMQYNTMFNIPRSLMSHANNSGTASNTLETFSTNQSYSKMPYFKGKYC